MKTVALTIVLLCVACSHSWAQVAINPTPPTRDSCWPNGVGKTLLATLDYLASNHQLSGSVIGAAPNLITNGDFEKDLSGLTLQHTGQPADFQCICSGPSPNCNPNAQCNAGGTDPPSTYYDGSNFTDMMHYLEFQTELNYQWAWSSTIGTGYFAIKNTHGVNSSYTDHTSAAYGYGGQGLMIDGPDGSTGYQRAWYKVFTLLPNRTYKFTYWFLGFPESGGTKAQFAFGIDPDDKGYHDMDNLQLDGNPFTTGWPYIPTTNIWHKLSGTFTTTTSTTVNIAVYTYNLAGLNNDCVFDDMSMVELDGCNSTTWSQIFNDHIHISYSFPTLTGQCTTCGIDLVRRGINQFDFSHIQHVSKLRPDPDFSGTRNAFLVDVDVWDPAHPSLSHDTFTMRGFFDCDYIFDCAPKPCCSIVGDTVNPFVQGLRGNWRPNKAYIYNAQRIQDPVASGIRSNVNQGVYVRQSGIYDQFQKFWTYNGSQDKWQPDGASNVYWSWKAEVTKINPYGADVENKDPLNRYSSAIYGYNYSAATAVGNNARYRQLAYDGFEDYDFYDPTCEVRHNNLEHPPLADIAHTGLKSLRIEKKSKVFMVRPITNYLSGEPPVANPAFGDPYTVTDHDLLKTFAPDDNNDYVISFWTKEELRFEEQDRPSAAYFNYSHAGIEINIDGSLVLPLSTQRGKIIEGWQQITYTFRIPPGSTKLELAYKHGELPIYYDDFRMYPIRATMKSYVYNPVTLRLMAELDENNYATFYEYDIEGKLSRVKKETEKGIYSIQESRTSMPKQ